MPTGRPIAFHERHVATRATNAAGDDVTEALRAQDRDHAPGVIVDRRFVGYLAEEQRLTLEIDADALALMTGRRIIPCPRAALTGGRAAS